MKQLTLMEINTGDSLDRNALWHHQTWSLIRVRMQIGLILALPNVSTKQLRKWGEGSQHTKSGERFGPSLY